MTIGSLAVNIVATTGKFTQGLNKAKSSLGKFVSGIGAAQTAVAGLAIAGIGAIVDAAIEAGGKLQELTTKLHISSEALTALHYAADQMESSAGAVDSAIQKMTLTLGKAAEGSDKAINSFARLNLDFTKLLALPVEQQFLAIVDAIHKIPDAAQRAATAQAIFGKGAKEIMPLITAGTTAITEYGQKAAEAGAIVGTDTVQALDDAGDSVNRFKASWESLKLSVVGTFAPAITFAMDLIVGAIKRAKAAWFILQYAITGGIELISRYILKMEEGLSHLPLIGNTFSDMSQKDQMLVDDLARRRGELGQKIKTNLGFGGSSDNPLKAPNSKQVEKNTATTNEKLDRVVDAINARPPVNLQMAGVR